MRIAAARALDAARAAGGVLALRLAGCASPRLPRTTSRAQRPRFDVRERRPPAPVKGEGSARSVLGKRATTAPNAGRHYAPPWSSGRAIAPAPPGSRYSDTCAMRGAA